MGWREWDFGRVVGVADGSFLAGGEVGGGLLPSGGWRDGWVLAVAAGGRNEALTVFRRFTAPEKIRIDRTEGSNSGELERMGFIG